MRVISSQHKVIFIQNVLIFFSIKYFQRHVLTGSILFALLLFWYRGWWRLSSILLMCLIKSKSKPSCCVYVLPSFVSS